MDASDAPALTARRATPAVELTIDGETVEIDHGAVVIAAITSCTNTSNPAVMIGAGLLAKKAVERGLTRKPWVKTSLAPGSKVVTEYYEKAGLTPYLEALGFNTVGYGCTTCIGNSGPLPEEVSQAVAAGDLVACAVLSGNRNFEARIHPEVKANYLASPPLVVAYALAGRMDIDITTEPLGHDARTASPSSWPTSGPRPPRCRRRSRARSGATCSSTPTRTSTRARTPGASCRCRPASCSRGRTRPPTCAGRRTSTAWPPSRDDLRHQRRALPRLDRRLGDDRPHLAGRLDQARLARRPLPRRARHRARRLQLVRLAARQPRGDGARHVRERPPAQPARSRLRGDLDRPPSGGRGDDDLRRGRALPRRRRPTIVLAGKEYGSGSSRDWAAKGPNLLGVRAVIAESYERIHRSNLLMMGILPLQFLPGENLASLGLTGREEFSVTGVDERRGARGHRPRRRASSSARSCGSTRRASASTSATAGSSRTCCGACSPTRPGSQPTASSPPRGYPHSPDDGSRDDRSSWGIEPVPQRLRVLGGVDLGLLWGNLGVSLLVVVAGAILVPALSLPCALVAIVVGCLIGNLMLAAAGVIGAQARVPGMTLMRAPLGRRGSFLPTASTSSSASAGRCSSCS